MNKKVMMYATGALILLFLIGGFAWKVQADKTNANAVNNRIDVIVDKVSAMFTDDKKELLATNVSEKNVAEVEELIDAEKNTKMSDETAERLDEAISDLADVKQMIEAQVLVDTLLDDKGVLAVEAVAIDNAEKKVEALQDRKSAFVEIQMEVIEEARHQLLEIETAKAAVEALRNDQEKLTRKQYEEALALVEAIKQKKAKAELMTLLDEVGKALEKKEAELAEKEEAKKKEEANASTNNSSNPPKGTNSVKFESEIDGYYLGMTEKELLKVFDDNNVQVTRTKSQDGTIQYYNIGEDITCSVINGKLVEIFMKVGNIPTAEGIKVGDSLKRIESIYGTDYNKEHSKYGYIEYYDGNVYLMFLVSDKIVYGWSISKIPFTPPTHL